MLVMLLSSEIDVKPLQYAKAQLPILVTSLGITVFLQPLINTLVAVSIMALQLYRLSYIEFLSSTTIDVKLLQSWKILFPKLVISLPIMYC